MGATKKIVKIQRIENGWLVVWEELEGLGIHRTFMTTNDLIEMLKSPEWK